MVTGVKDGNVDISKCFKDAWELCRLDMGPLAAVAFVAAVIVTFGGALISVIFNAGANLVGWESFLRVLIHSGANLVGALLLFALVLVVYGWAVSTMLRIFLGRIRRGRAAEYADLTSTEQVGALLGIFIAFGVILGVGYLVLIIPGIIFTTMWIYALPMVADRNCGLSQAMAESRELAAAPGYMNTFAAWLVGALVPGVVAAVLSTIPFIGSLLALMVVPFFVAYVVSMYFQAIGQGRFVAGRAGR